MAFNVSELRVANFRPITAIREQQLIKMFLYLHKVVI